MSVLGACLEAGLDIGERLNVQPSWVLIPAKLVDLLQTAHTMSEQASEVHHEVGDLAMQCPLDSRRSFTPAQAAVGFGTEVVWAHLHELGCLVGVCCQIVDGETQGACCGFVSSLDHAAHISKEQRTGCDLTTRTTISLSAAWGAHWKRRIHFNKGCQQAILDGSWGGMTYQQEAESLHSRSNRLAFTSDK